MASRGRLHLWLLRWVRPLPRLVGEVLALAFVAWEGVQGRYSAASHAGILAVIGVVLLLTSIAGRGRQRKRSRTWVHDAARALRGPFVKGGVERAAVAGGVVWTLLIAATVGWDMASFLQEKHDLPTLSRIFGDVTGHDWGRALLFAAWLVLGLYLAIGWRLPERGRDEAPRRSDLPVGPRPSRSASKEEGLR